MTKNTFKQYTDEGRKSFMSYNERTKNYPTSSGRNEDIDYDNQVMVEQPGDPRCPVKSFECYLGHLDPNCNLLFPYPLDHITYMRRKEGNKWKDNQIWYSANPNGANTLGAKLKKLVEANLFVKELHKPLHSCNCYYTALQEGG